MNKIIFQIQCAYTGVYSLFLALLCLRLSVEGYLLRGCRIESASCCYFAPTQAVMEILIVIILVNQFSYAEKVLLWMPSGIYCNPCNPCAPCCSRDPDIRWAESCASHTAPIVGASCVLNICFPPALCCHGSRIQPNKCTFLGAMSVNFLSVHF